MSEKCYPGSNPKEKPHYELLNQIELDGIIIPETFVMEEITGGRCIYLTFSKKYGNDIEGNGIGVKIVNEEVTEIGFKEIAF